MSRTLCSLLIGTATVVSSVALSTSAATALSTSVIHILLNDRVLPSPIAVKNMIPLYYVHNVLTALGITDKWNGRNRTWTIDSQYPLATTTNTLTDSSGKVVLIVNGKTLGSGLWTTVSIDPYSRVATTYLSINDVVSVLNALCASSTFDGKGNALSIKVNEPSPVLDFFGNGRAMAYYPFQATAAAAGVPFHCVDPSQVVFRDTKLTLFQVDVLHRLGQDGNLGDAIGIYYVYGNYDTLGKKKYVEVSEYTLEKGQQSSGAGGLSYDGARWSDSTVKGNVAVSIETTVSADVAQVIACDVSRS